MVIILVWLFFSGGDNKGKSNVSKEIGWEKLYKVILNRDYAQIKIVNKEYAEVFIKPEAIRNADTLYNDLFSNDGGIFNRNNDVLDKLNASYVYKFADFNDFKDKLKTVQDEWTVRDTTGKNLSEEEKAKIISSNVIDFKSEEKGKFFTENFGIIFFSIVTIVLWIFLFRGFSRGGSSGGIGNIFSVGKSKAKLYDKDKNAQVTFADVAGLKEAKVEVMEIVDFLKNPGKYTKLGGKIPKGALLVGPPGTGKTLLAKAVAGEAKVPFFSMSGSDFTEMFVGVGASRVRDLFNTAKAKAPCIIFIDEIDAIGRARGKNIMSGANDERENTLNQLLTEMDGFGTNAGVIILAATNRADILDKALLRAGRFDRQIYVELPELKDREEIFKVHMKNLKFNEQEVNPTFLAKQTPGFSGADIANICNESALIAARRSKNLIGKQDFLDAVDRIIGGLEKKSKIISPKEKERIAYHEAGHASVSWLLEFANPLLKVTIVPRGQALGAAWYIPEERQITTKQQMMHQMISLLGGRASEFITFGDVSTGALNDLERATQMATAMVKYYGLDEQIGNVSYFDSTGQTEYSFQRQFSEKTAEAIDERVHALLEEAYKQACAILTQNRDKLKQLAELLRDKEVIFREDVEKIFGPRQWVDNIEGIKPQDDAAPVQDEAVSQSDAQSKEGDDAAQTQEEAVSQSDAQVKEGEDAAQVNEEHNDTEDNRS
ncbi:MAG: ATP-dependent zinc metalloprotease FtsH [Bacteroidales bacterium]|nr:ATP-dependent zinc metalloprotease FtsH [Bacteroidales bacterium]